MTSSATALAGSCSQYRRIAVQVRGCFWHRCSEPFHAPKANADWWRLKLESVVARDADTERRLAAAGYLPVVVWEHEVLSDAADRLRALDAACRADFDGPSPTGTPRAPAADPELLVR